MCLCVSVCACLRGCLRASFNQYLCLSLCVSCYSYRAHSVTRRDTNTAFPFLSKRPPILCDATDSHGKWTMWSPPAPPHWTRCSWKCQSQRPFSSLSGQLSGRVTRVLARCHVCPQWSGPTLWASWPCSRDSAGAHGLLGSCLDLIWTQRSFFPILCYQMSLRRPGDERACEVSMRAGTGGGGGVSTQQMFVEGRAVKC